MMQLTSINYSRLIQFTAQKKHLQMLNKTQVNKILFMVYGRYLAMTGEKLFNDDTPKAWPYGPVFPIMNKRLKTNENTVLTPQEIEAFKQNTTMLTIVLEAVKVMHHMSAQSLTNWSHKVGSPWYRTIYESSKDGKLAAWNTEIPESYIKEYFTTKQPLS